MLCDKCLINKRAVGRLCIECYMKQLPHRTPTDCVDQSRAIPKWLCSCCRQSSDVRVGELCMQCYHTSIILRRNR